MVQYQQNKKQGSIATLPNTTTNGAVIVDY